MANDTDPDKTYGDTLAVASVAGATGGAVKLNTDGTVTFTPTTNYTGAASFTYKALDSKGSVSATDATVNLTVAAASQGQQSVAGIGYGPIAVDKSGNAYQLTKDPNSGTYSVGVFTATGSSTTVALPGEVQPYANLEGALIPSGNGVVISTYSIDRAAGKYKSVQVSRINASGAIATTEVVGAPYGLVVAADGTAYQAILKYATELSDGSFSVVRVTPGGAFSTFGTSSFSPQGDLVIGPDGTAYQAGFRTSPADPSFGGGGIMVIPKVGDVRFSGLRGAPMEGSVAPGKTGTAYLTFRTYDATTDDATTTVMTLTGSTTTTQVIVGEPAFGDGHGVVAGTNGFAYQTTTTRGVDGSDTVYITRIGGATSAAIAGSPETDLQVAADGSAFQVVYDGMGLPVGQGTYKMVAISPTGGVSVVPLNDFWFEFSVGPDNKAYSVTSVCVTGCDSTDFTFTSKVTILASNGSAVTIPLGGFARNDKPPAFGPDGTPFLSVEGDKGFFIKNLSTGQTSDPIANPGEKYGVDELQVSPDGTAWLFVYNTNPVNYRIVAMAPNGKTVVNTVVTPLAPPVFASDGTAYLTVQPSAAFSGPQVLGITPSGVTKVVATATVGTASYGIGSPVTIANGTAYWSYSTVTSVGGKNQALVQLVRIPLTGVKTPSAV